MRIVLLLMTCLSVSLKAQQVAWETGFEDKPTEFWTGNVEGSCSGAFNNGWYEMKTTTSSAMNYSITQDANLSKDYTFETYIRLDAGDTYGYGVLWGYKDVDNYNRFLISKANYYLVSRMEKGTSTPMKEWTTTTLVKPLGEVNKLTVQKKGPVYTLSINDEVVYASTEFKLFGNKLGFQLNDTMQVSLDRVVVYQDKEPIRLLKGMPTGIVKENLGPLINTKTDDRAPVISPDGHTLYFVRDNEADYDKEEQMDRTDVWYSTLNADGSWSAAKDMGKPINNKQSNTVLSVTPDNNTVLLMNTYNSDGSFKSGGFSMSHRTATGWSVPVDVVMDDYYTDNAYEDVCLSSDGKTMLLTLERADSYGDNDIYVSFLQNNGNWSKPKNLGATINTFFEEGSPFLAADMVTMYYSTYGKPGYGSKDIFVTRRLDNSWTKWSEPENLGPEINTKDWDAYYVIPASGNYAYTVSNTSGLGGSDLFRIKLPDAAKPNPVVLVKGKVLNAKTKEPIAANISYEVLPSGMEAGIARSNPATGEYKIVLPYGANYGYHAKVPGYLSVNENLELVETKAYAEVVRDLYLVPIEVGQSIVLNNVFFVQSKAVLQPSSYPELDRLAKIMQDNPSIEIKLSGHTDNQGDPAKNVQLSEERVKVVEEYLVAKGINTSRISGQGFGGAKPIASNATEETRKLNRRVEFTITKK